MPGLFFLRSRAKTCCRLQGELNLRKLRKRVKQLNDEILPLLTLDNDFGGVNLVSLACASDRKLCNR